MLTLNSIWVPGLHHSFDGARYFHQGSSLWKRYGLEPTTVHKKLAIRVTSGAPAGIALHCDMSGEDLAPEKPLSFACRFHLTITGGWARIIKSLSRGPVAQFGSALPWHGRGRRFDPDQVHQFSLMSAVYILQSEKTQKFYIGSADDPRIRLVEHQRGQTISRRGRGPWVLVHQEEFATLSESRRRERQLKSWKSHRSIQELIDASKVII